MAVHKSNIFIQHQRYAYIQGIEIEQRAMSLIPSRCFLGEQVYSDPDDYARLIAISASTEPGAKKR